MFVIKVENLSKKYLIRHEQGSYIALRDRLAHPIKAFKNRITNKPEEFWALNDVSFEVEQGDVVGIIGSNGSGKSTLLKVLSRITPPTKGQAILKGRVASLLEVGTGFHGELSGRENIFLSGVILGMKKAEIQQKFEEIVAFAGVEKFLDTPVKYYSSGMNVRLGFAVAAHLNSEILIIDEVLAVGDAEFQKKCLGKMDDIAKNQGRTILFVSHDTRAVKGLCKNCIFLKDGQIIILDNCNKVVDYYLNNNLFVKSSCVIRKKNINEDSLWIKKIKICSKKGELKNLFSAQEEFILEIDINNCNDIKKFHAGWILHDSSNQEIAASMSYPLDDIVYTNKENLISCLINPESLVPGKYSLSLSLSLYNQVVYDTWSQAIFFEITDNNPGCNNFSYPGVWPVNQYVKHKWLC